MTTKLLILAGFCIAFVAGLMMGLSSPQRAAVAPGTQSVTPTTGPTSRPMRHRGFLASELGLTSEQQAQLDKIWSETARRGMRESEDPRRQYRKDREDAIVALIRAEDQPAYKQILEDYQKKMESLDTQRRAAFQSAVEQTKALLTPEQRTKYEAILKRQSEGGPGGPRGDRDRGDRPPPPPDGIDHSRRPGDRATTQASPDR
jgi:Spy/CpxP family protein refolding chaperone